MTVSAALPQRILDHYNDMPRGERRIADMLLENSTSILTSSATQLAARAGVSKATAARFFKRLGYASFRAAQRSARDEGISALPAAYGARLPRIVGHEFDLSQHLQNEVQNLVRTIEQQRSDELARAVRLLARADKLWVVGFGDNYPLAHLARALLIKVRADVRMIPIGGFSVPEEFASISASDAMLALGVGRRTRSLRNVVVSARQARAKLVYLTDASGSGEAGSDGVTLRCRITGPMLFDSPTAAVSLICYLCSSLATLLGEATINRLRTIDSIHQEWGDLVQSADL